MNSLGFIDDDANDHVPYDASRYGGPAAASAAAGGGPRGQSRGYAARWSDTASSATSNDDASSTTDDTCSSVDPSDIATPSSTAGGDDGDDADDAEYLAALPAHACKYCGFHDALSVARCTTCKKWFCNSRSGTSGSHIVAHMVKAKHKEITLHLDGPWGDSPLECWVCGSRNIFLLGFLPSTEESAVVLICREPCLHSQTLRDMGWDNSQWLPLVEERQLLSWLCSVPTAKQTQRCRSVSNNIVSQLEDLWKKKADADLEDLRNANSMGGGLLERLPTIPFHFKDGYHFREVLLQHVDAECRANQELKEAIVYDNISIVWELGLNRKRIAKFQVPQEDAQLVLGDELKISHAGTKWEAFATVLRVEPSANAGDELWCELKTGTAELPPSTTTRFHVNFVFKAVSFDRMRNAMKIMATSDVSVSSFLYHALLGHPQDPITFKLDVPQDLAAPSLATLNLSQSQAVKFALTHPLTLIQGPPGTGKTVTSATIVYQMCVLNSAQVLVTSPSNVAVDQLTERIAATGLNVVRVMAKTRESITSPVDHLTLHKQLQQFAASSPAYSDLQKLQRLLDDVKDLDDRDRRRYNLLKRQAEADLLSNADVICTTCSGAGDSRLAEFRFKHVLIDESTQATEPETLIPIVMGAKQVVLVGDHCQMGPVIVCKPAEKAGYGRSMFERLLQLGHRPHRLDVQYRMHPCLSQFSSNAFYEGSLQNGVTAEDRDASLVFDWPNRRKPMFFYNSIAPEEIGPSGSSFLNRNEAALAEKFVTALLRRGVTPDQIAVITPYESQRCFLVNFLSRNGPLGPEVYKALEVASVDSFQGREKEFVILTCVRSNDQLGIGFLSDWRRLNVALTRARRGVIIIGNARVLSRHVLWHALLTHFKELDLIVDDPVGDLARIKVALQKPRQMDHAIGPQTFSGPAMYQSSFQREAEGSGGEGGGSGVPSSQLSSSSDVQPYIDLRYVPGMAPAMLGMGGQQGSYPASQQTQSGWSLQSSQQ